MKQAGFSLFELMIVVCLMMIIATLGVVNTQYLNKSVINTHIDVLYNTCIYLQHTAMASGQTQELILDDADQSYAYNGHYQKLPQCMKFGILAHAKGPPSSPHASLTSAVTFANKKIIFYPDGIIGAGAVYIIDSNGSYLYALSSAVAHVSYLRKYRYDGAWHLL